MYPASFFYFRAATTATLQGLIARRRRGRDCPDVLHVHFLAFAEPIQQAGFPTLCTSHSLLFTDLAYTRGVFDGKDSDATRHEIQSVKRAEQGACLHVQNVSVLSQYHSKELTTHYGRQNTMLLVAPFTAEPFFTDKPRKTARQESTIDIREMFTITFVGRAGFTDQVQHVRFSRKASAGVLKPRDFLGVELMAQVRSSMSRAV